MSTTFETALLKAIYSALANGTVGSLVDGRVFLDVAPDGTQFPYVVFFIISSAQDDPFSGTLENTFFQFSLFSASQSPAEILAIYNALKAALDDAQLTLSTGDMITMRRDIMTTDVEEITTESGTELVKHWKIDYEVIADRV